MSTEKITPSEKTLSPAGTVELAGLRVDAVQGQKLGDGNEMVALGLEGIHDLKGGVDRGWVDIMEQDNAVRLNVLQNCLGDLNGVTALPISWVHGPFDHRHFDDTVLAHLTVRRPEPVRAGAAEFL